MSRWSRVAEPGLASPMAGDVTDESGAPDRTPAFPFDAGPYDRLPQPLGVTSVDVRACVRRAAVAVLVAWVPLALLSAWEGYAIGPSARESFLLDVAAHARFLVALPLFVLADAVVLPKLGVIVRQFMTSGIVQPPDKPAFMALVSSTRRALKSPVTTGVIIALAFLSSLRMTELVYPSTISTWPAPIIDGERARSIAGWWRTLVSQPLYFSIMAVWLWRAILWARFVFRVSRFDLRLIAAHPDQMGGLRFVLYSVRAFPVVAFALATAMAGNVAVSMLLDGRSIMEFTHVIVIAVAFVVLLFVCPPLVLRAPLHRLRADGIRLYGELASDLGFRFEKRWLRPGREIPDDAMEAPDFSAVTDAYQIVGNVNGIKLLAVDVTCAAPVIAATLLPFVPLLMIEYPVTDMLKFAANVLL